MNTRQPDGSPHEPLHDAWHQASAEMPSAGADAAILAAARAAQDGERAATTARRNERRGFRHWQPLLAAAGVAGLAFVLVQTLPREHTGFGEMALPAKSAPARAEPPQSEPSAEWVPEPAASPPAASIPAAPQPEPVPSSAEQRSAISVAPPAATSDASRAERNTAPTAKAQSAAPATQAAAAAPSPAMAEPPATQGRMSTDSARLDAAAAAEFESADSAIQASLAQVEQLFDSGRLDEAAQELRRLRSLTDRADALLPEPMHAWATTVR